MTTHTGPRHNHIQNTRLPLSIALSLALWLITLLCICSFNKIRSFSFYPLQKDMNADAYYADGTSEHFADGDFGVIDKGERLQIHIPIPDEVHLEGAELYIPLYNSIVDVYLDQELLYKDEYDPTNISAHYGNRIYEVILPPDYASREVTLDVISVVSLPFSDLKGVGIISANEGWKQIIAGQEIIFVVALSLMVLALLCAFYFGIRSIFLKRIQIGLPISLFELLIIAWFFGSMRMFYPILGNTDVCAKIEYYALFLAPLPLAAFIYLVMDVPGFKKATTIVSGTYLIYYIMAAIEELSPIQKNYSDLLTSMHLLAGAILLVLVAALFAGTHSTGNPHLYILRWGMLISIFCGLFELARYNVIKFLLHRSWVSEYGVSTLAILVIAVSLVIYLVSFSAEEYTAQVEHHQLLDLAYRDALTDMPNRASCYRSIEEMDAGKIHTYTMVFFDLNNLKLANDTYGHDMGDRLLKTAAGFIKEVFSDDGFCARWGGDEFVACVYGDEAKALTRMERFRQHMQTEDASGSFPFKVSAACGCAHSSEEHPMDPLDAIRQADAFMYENKVRMKAARKMGMDPA